MKLRRIVIIAAFALAAAVGLRPASASQDQVAGRCVVYIPQEWGTFRGASQGFGMAFEDSEGRLRFVNQMPCNLEGSPVVSLEVRRR